MMLGDLTRVYRADCPADRGCGGVVVADASVAGSLARGALAAVVVGVCVVVDRRTGALAPGDVAALAGTACRRRAADAVDTMAAGARRSVLAALPDVGVGGEIGQGRVGRCAVGGCAVAWCAVGRGYSDAVSRGGVTEGAGLQEAVSARRARSLGGTAVATGAR